MTRDQAMRKCSHCGNNGHNSRTCDGIQNDTKAGSNCVKLFGVNIMLEKIRDESMKKSLSLGNLKACNIKHDNNINNNDTNNNNIDNGSAEDGGYLSDGLLHNKKRKAAHERKKGKAWTEEEHRTFLEGLKKLGKGDWRGIARNFVTTRTPTQVASHAQKYFLRQQAAHDKKKRRSSLFDTPLKHIDVPQHSLTSHFKKTIKLSGLADSSKTMFSNNRADIYPKHVETPTQILYRLPHLCLKSPSVVPLLAACSVPNYAIPYVVGVPRDVPFMPMVNFSKESSFPAASSKSIGKIVTTSSAAVVARQPSGLPNSPQSSSFTNNTAAASAAAFQAAADHATSSSSSTETNGLELKIGPPQPQSQQTNLSSQPSGAIKVI